MDVCALRMPSKVYFGRNSLSKITDIIYEHSFRRIALFTDKGIEACGLLNDILNQFIKADVSYIILDNLKAEPTYHDVQILVDECREYHADAIFACGGGSVMDTAKISSLLVHNDYRVIDLVTNGVKPKKGVPTVLIPTTAGTGSEATQNAIVTVPENELKLGVINDSMICDYAILDPIMTASLPSHIAASTGLDALAHAIECLTSKKANCFSDLFALEALDLILN